MDTNLNRIGSTIRRHRENAGVKVAQLAARIGASRNTITNYESGRTVPSATDLMRIAQALGCSLSDFIGQEPNGEVRFAYRAHKKIEADAELRIAAKKYFRAYREIEEIMDTRLDLRLPDESFDPDEFPPAKWIPAAAARCREIVGIRFSGTERIALLLENLGVRTLYVGRADRGFDGISAVDGDMSFIILQKREKAVERMITSAVHELGHLVLHPELFKPSAEDVVGNRDYEKEANLFAGHFLVPTDDLLQVWKKDRLQALPVEHALLLLKRVFHVSYWLLYRRISDEGLTKVSYPHLVEATKRLLNIHGQAKMENLEPEPMKPAQVECSARFESLVRSAFLQDKIGVAKVAEMLQITVGEAKELTFQWMQPGHAVVE